MSLILGDIQTAYYTAAQWTAWNGILKAGQRGIESDTLKEKVGDGVTVWNSLSYLSAPNYDLQAVLAAGNNSGNLSAKFGTGTVYFGATNQAHIQNVSGLELHNSTANTLVNLTDTGFWKVDATQYMPNLTASRILSLDASKNVVSSYTTTGIGTKIALSTSPTFVTDITTPKINGVSGNILLTNDVQTSGAITNFTFTNSANTGQSASTEISNFKITGASKTWANGGGATTIATQRWNYFTANTAATSGGGSLTITNSYGAYFEAATASGVTITNNFSAGFDSKIFVNGEANVGFVSFGGSTSLNNSGNALQLGASGTWTSSRILTNGTTRFETFGLTSSGATNAFVYSPASNTGQTSSTEINGYLYNSYTRTWANGGGATTIATQRERYYKTVTWATSGGGSLTITDGYAAYFEAPTASGVTITNNWAIGASGNVKVLDGSFLYARIKPRVTTITSSATPTINTDNCDAVTITALAANITSFTTNLSGTPNNFDKLTIRIKDDGTARTLAWGTSFEAKGVALPTTTVISKVLTIGFIYDSVSAKWGCVSSAQEV